VLVTAVSHAKMAESIKMLFGTGRLHGSKKLIF